jgi:PAS domain S-box-containing protein
MSATAVLHVRPDGWSGPALGDEFDVTVVNGSDAAVAALERDNLDCAVVEADLGAEDGIDVVAALRERAPSLPILLCSAIADGTLAAAATRHDVTEYVPRDGSVRVADRIRAVIDTRNPLGESFESIAGSIADAVVAIDPDSRIVFANDELAALSGHAHEDLVGDSFERLIPPEYRDAHRAAVQQYVSSGERTIDWEYVELSLLRADGEEVPVAVSFGEFEHSGNRYFTGVIREITERKERQHALEATNDALEELATLAARSDLSRTERLREAIAIGRERLDLPIGYLTRTDGETQHVEVVEGASDLVTEDMSAPLSKTYCRETIQQDELLAIADAEQEGWGNHPSFEAFGVSCYLGGKVTVDGETYGTLCFASRGARERSFTDAEGRLVRLLVGWIGNEIERDQRESELQRYAHIIEAVDDGVYALDDDGEFTLVNDAMTDLTGHDETALLNSHTSKIKDDATVDRAVSIVREMLAGTRSDEETFELALQRADGTSFPSQDHMTILWDDDDEFDGTAGVIRDVTEQKERDEALEGLLGTTRSLMRAQTPTEVAEIVVSAASETLGFEQNLVRLHDPETETLVPAEAVAPDTSASDRPVRDDDEGYTGEAFTSGQTLVVDDLREEVDYDSGLSVSGMYLPLGDHGTLSIGSTDPAAFDDSDRSMAEILVSNATAAFDRVERERELLRYETAVENVNDMLYVLDGDGRFQLVTQPLASYLGFDRDEMLESRPDVVLNDETLDRFRDAIRTLWAEDRESVEIETQLTTADGSPRPVEIEISLIPGESTFKGTVGVVRDRTELHETRERLHQERTRFSYLFDALPDPVVETELVDGTPVVRSTNPAFVETFDLEQTTVTGASLTSLLRAPDGQGGEGSELSRVATDDSVQGELRRWTADGFRDFLFRGVPYERGDGRQFAFGIYTDITEQRERQRRLEVLNRVLRHNLRNDMTVVLGTAEELRRRSEDPANRSLFDTLLRKAEEVVSLSDRAREIEAAVQREGGSDRHVSPTELVDGVVEELAPEYPDATVSTTAGTVPTVADERLRTAIYEVVENALEHNEAPTVEISVTADESSVEITVSDDGSGIPEDELAVVAGDVPITQLTHGTGLGLWLVTWLTESYGGTATFDCEDGTTVTLRLPHTDR